MLATLTLLPLIAGSFLLANAQGGTTCNATNLCPSSAPCCSEYGYCGTGTFCLGGCDPLTSNSLTSCMPNPVCESANHTFPDMSRILSNSTYFTGNASEYDWVVDTGSAFNTNSSGGELALTLTQSNGGTLLSSTRYVHYGTITASIKTGRWAGVVTAFITMSSIRDEIDWEWPGANTTEAQTNFFWQGVVPSITGGTKTGGLSDTFSNYHDYTIDWQPDALIWKIDGQVVRTLNRSSTIDSNGVAHYPSTPSRIQLSLWPAGISSSAPGTVAWAGGMIDWNNPDYVAAGHFYALVKSVNVVCSDPSQPGSTITSYVYGSNSSAFNPSISFSNATTINGAVGTHASSSLATIGAVAAGLLLLQIVL